MSFTARIKDEICMNVLSKEENICMLCGFVRNSYLVEDNKLSFYQENPKVIRKIYSLFREIYDISGDITQSKNNSFGKKTFYNLKISGDYDALLVDLFVLDNDGEKVLDIPEYFLDSDDFKRAYIRGAFLASGSVNDPKKSRYHLEFLVDFKKEASFLKDLLEYFGIRAKLIVRDKGYMTYIKEAEKIGDFLRLVSANASILYYEDIRIYRDHKNMINRLNNCEQANIDKVVSSSNKILDNINLIDDKMGLDFLDDKLSVVVEYRKKYPDVSLNELSNIISYETGKDLSKSGLNHRFRKITQMADKLREK